MNTMKTIAVTTLIGVTLSGCSVFSAFKDRTLPTATTEYQLDSNGRISTSPHTIKTVRQAVLVLQNEYQELAVAYDADASLYSYFYLVTATASAAAAIFGAHEDYLKGAALAAGVGVGAETIVSPQQKRDALYASVKKVGCLYTASIPLMADTSPTPNQSLSAIISSARQIHFNLLEEFKSGRVDYKSQAEALIAASEQASKLKLNAHDMRNDQKSGVRLYTQAELDGAENAAVFQEARAAVLKCVL